jgi:hypothetical protein
VLTLLVLKLPLLRDHASVSGLAQRPRSIVVYLLMTLFYITPPEWHVKSSLERTRRSGEW